MDSSCRPHRELVASGPYCSIEQCECGTLHVTLGALTIRVTPDVLESIGITIREAQEHIELRDQRAAIAARAIPRGMEKLSS